MQRNELRRLSQTKRIIPLFHEITTVPLSPQRPKSLYLPLVRRSLCLHSNNVVFLKTFATPARTYGEQTCSLTWSAFDWSPVANQTPASRVVCDGKRHSGGNAAGWGRTRQDTSATEMTYGGGNTNFIGRAGGSNILDRRWPRGAGKRVGCFGNAAW